MEAARRLQYGPPIVTVQLVLYKASFGIIIITTQMVVVYFCHVTGRPVSAHKAGQQNEH